MSVLVKKNSPRVFRGLPPPNMFQCYRIARRALLVRRKSVGFPRPLRVETLVPLIGIYKPCVRSKRVELRREKAKIDDTLSRVQIWRTLFGTEPMPEIEENAAKRYSGTLNFPDNFDFDKLLRKVRKGN